MALIPLNTFKTKTAVLTTAEYNSETCARDTGLIVDSLAFDLLYGYDQEHGISTQSTFSGLQYWSQGAIEIPGDVVQTLAALDRAKEISKLIVLNQDLTDFLSSSYPKDGNGDPDPPQYFDPNEPGSVESSQKKVVDEFDLISRIIESGTKGVTDLIVPNEHDIHTLAIDWVGNTAYDYGTILKATVEEIDRYYRVIIAGTVDDLVPPTHESGSEANGTAILEYMPFDYDLYNSAALLLNNIELIQTEVAAYINDTFNKITFDKEKFTEYTRLVIDSLAFDLLFRSSSQSKFIGLQYWEYDTTTKIPDQEPETIAAIQRIKSIVLQIIKNEPVTRSTNNLVDQVFDEYNPGNAASVTATGNLFDIIINILTNGIDSDPIDPMNPDVDVIGSIVSNTQITTYPGLLNAYQLIQANRLFIQQEIIAWIDDQVSNEISPFTSESALTDVQKEKCYRDTGYIVDCVSFDLVYTSTTQATRQSVQAGTYYYNKKVDENDNPVSILTDTEQSKTVTVLNHLKTIIDDIITGKAIAVTYQSDIKQAMNLPPATDDQVEYVTTQFDLITNVIENSPFLITDVESIGLTPSADTNDVNGFRLLLANKEFLVAEAVAFLVNSTESGFSLDGARLERCKTDVEYVVNSIVFDMRTGGNRQAVHSGVYYYNHSSSVSVIPKERIDAVEAYTQMKSTIEYVLKNEPVPSSIKYQSKVKQFTNLTPISSNQNVTDINAEISRLISRITRIIGSGPLSITDIDDDKQSINLSITQTLIDDRKRAFNILLANREFIIAEIIGYLDTRLLTRPNTTKIYTAPPGVTAIILMAQAANVTSDPVNVTFAHYRNIPVFADPATYNGYQAANTITELVKNFTIPPQNAASLVDGKLIVETFDSVIAYANVNEGVKVTLSILETANA